MNSTTQLQNLAQLRGQIYQCFDRAADALMDTLDALLTETQAQTLPELSLSPLFRRRWHSLYEAFEDGRINQAALRCAFADHAPWPSEERIILAVDACSIARPKARTARDRGLVHEANLPPKCAPVVPGWQFSALALMPATNSSWTYLLDNKRIPTHQSQGQVAAEQLQELMALLPPDLKAPPLLLADGYYSCLGFLQKTQDIACDKLVRLAKNRVLVRAAPPRTGKRGRPREHGTPFKCQDATTHGPPDEIAVAPGIQVACWGNLHFKQAKGLPVKIVRVEREAAVGTQRDPRVSWFVFVGEQMPSLGRIPEHYGRRYSIEHGFRLDKQDLLWERVRLRTPEQFERFTQIVACVRNQLCLARGLPALRQPWERKEGMDSPSQVRRGMRAIMGQLGTPAGPCRPRGNSPGRVKGTQITPAVRYPLIRKSPKTGKAKPRLVQT